MKFRCILLSQAVAIGVSAAPVFIDGFATPKFYQDGQPLAGVPAKKGNLGGGWVGDDAAANQEPGAFLTVVSPPPAPAEPVDMKAEREKIAAMEKSMDRETKQKEREKRERVEKGARLVAAMKRTPGELHLVGGQKGVQSILMPFQKPVEPPYYFSFVVDMDVKSKGTMEIQLEDEAGEMVVLLQMMGTDMAMWKLASGGNFKQLICKGIKAPMLLIVGVEKDPVERDTWLVRSVANPADFKDPFKSSATISTVKVAAEPKPVGKLRLNKGGGIEGRIDEIRLGTSLRDVLP